MRSPKILLVRRTLAPMRSEHTSQSDLAHSAADEGAAAPRPDKGSRTHARTISESPRFAWPTLALLALLMLALPACPVTASAQGPAGAGGQQAPPNPASQQGSPAPTAQEGQPVRAAQPGSPAPAVPQASAQRGADAPRQQPATRPQQPLTPEAVLDRIIAEEQA